MSDTTPTTRWSWLWDDPRRFDLVVALATAGIGMLLIFGNRNRFDTGWPEVAAGVGAFVLVLFRRRQPLVLLAIAMIATAVHVAVWERPTPMVFAALVLLSTACVRLDRWVAIALGVGILYTVLAVFNGFLQEFEGGIRAFSGDVAIELGPGADPDEVAQLVTFLCSPAGAYISGALIPIDGGMLP